MCKEKMTTKALMLRLTLEQIDFLEILRERYGLRNLQAVIQLLITQSYEKERT